MMLSSVAITARRSIRMTGPKIMVIACRSVILILLMAEEANQGIDPSVAQARKSMGYEPKPEAGSPQSEAKEETFDPEAPKADSEEEEADKEEGSEEETKEEDEEDKEENEPQKPPAKTKPSRSERQLFKRVGDVEKILKDLPTQITSAITSALQTKTEGEPKLPASKIEELAKTLSEEFNADPGAVNICRS